MAGTNEWAGVLQELVTFVQVVEAGGFSAAARRLGQTPSAVSRQVALVAESTGQLYPGGDALGQALVQAVQRCAASGQTPEPELSMEMATTLLCLDATLDELDRPDLPHRIARLTERLQASLAGQPSAPIEPWMESLYREVSDRQTMGSVVQELRASLAEVEQQLDRFHRHRDERELLIPVPAQLATMRGVLSVLGLDQAAHATVRMRDTVEKFLVDKMKYLGTAACPPSSCPSPPVASAAR